MKRYANGKEWESSDDNYYDDDNIDDKGIKRHTNTHFKHIHRNDFHVKQIYEEETHAAYCLICAAMTNSQVGQSSHFTAIKCDKCGWERCIHDG